MTTKNFDDFGKMLTNNTPIFQVDAILASPEIIVRPTASEIYNIIVRSVKDYLERYIHHDFEFVCFIILNKKNSSKI